MHDRITLPSPSLVGNMMLCDGITRESVNPGSHALIRYLRSSVQWFWGETEVESCVGAWKVEVYTHSFGREEITSDVK